MHSLNRRDTLRGLVALCAGCVGPNQDTPSSPKQEGCAEASLGSSSGYCLVENFVARVVGGALLLPGESMLANIDDNTAVVVGHDTGGFFARSAICTHACCVVVLCADDSCSTLEPTPEPCGTIGPIIADRVLCPCHGSIFRISDGVALTGPATVSLPAYALVMDGDDLLVDTGIIVDSIFRI